MKTEISNEEQYNNEIISRRIREQFKYVSDEAAMPHAVASNKTIGTTRSVLTLNFTNKTTHSQNQHSLTTHDTKSSLPVVNPECQHKKKQIRMKGSSEGEPISV